MKVTVVIPFFNRAVFFDRLLSSIEQQEMTPDMVFVIDNGSDLEQVELVWNRIKQSLLKVCLVSTICTGNANYARNLGFYLADMGYIAFLDSDDWWEVDHLSKNVSLLTSSDKTAIYSGARVHRERTYINKSIDVNRLSSPFSLLFSKKGYLAQTSSYIVKKDAKLKSISWDESLRRHQDFDFFINHYYYGGGWLYSSEITTNIDWDSGGTKREDVQSKINFYKKWETLFPEDLKIHYLYNQMVFCIRQLELDGFYYYKRKFLDLNNSLYSKFLASRRGLLVRIYFINILEKTSLKNLARKIIRFFSN
ncbi:glycosyltransferase family 2 protein [Pseudoalteromonas gelatinilytica]|uniref:Glycosyltransferase family 2 protein n=1 Tax=Pseudoalteromonas gelatinilytica TaxID=1703256 RepID=A0A3A3ES11_9GAMM|nr:glycosyltransferase family 2 protein [Pseudoalteromonas profundi]RJF37997.1 glycosyltransferase family 2 protein [Pseudoalteromonas profundi]